MDRGRRHTGDDFFCWKFGVWYNLGDCVFRHVYRTTRECAECAQGASNTRLFGRPPEPPRWVKMLSVADRSRPVTMHRVEARRR